MDYRWSTTPVALDPDLSPFDPLGTRHVDDGQSTEGVVLPIGTLYITSFPASDHFVHVFVHVGEQLLFQPIGISALEGAGETAVLQ